MMIKKAYIVILFLFSILNVDGQRYSTFENWTTFAIDKKFNKFNLNIEEGWRVREFYLSRQNYTDIVGTYKFNNALEIGGGYRLTLKNHMFNILEVNNRFYFDLQVSKKIGDIEFSFRTRLQHTRLQWEDDFGLAYQTYSRNKFKIKYKLNDQFAFSGGYEMFLLFIPSGMFINENRFSIEGQYKIGNKWSVSLGYSLRNGIQVEDLLNTHIMALGVNVKL